MSDEIKQEHIDELERVLTEKRSWNMLGSIMDKSLFVNFSYYKLKSLFYRVEEIYFKVKDIFEKVQIEQYANETIDVEALTEIYNQKKLYKKYPNLNLHRLKELYDNPPKSLKSPAYKNHIIYDKIVTRKYIVGIMQMIFNNMDLIINFCGREGTGKTTISTQDAYICYYIMTQIGLIDYPFTLKQIMYMNLKSIINAFNKFSRDPFRIFILDEGNELNRKNWGNPLVQLFFQKLRRERKHLRIIFINLPQIGELMPDITLSRTNFVFQFEMKANVKTKLADKGTCSFFIIPRFPAVYSYYNKKEMTQEYIIDNLGKFLDDKKKYLQKIPSYLCVHKYERNGVWAFNEDEYDQLSKEANEAFSTSTVTLTRNEIYYLSKFINLKNMKVAPGTNAYHCLAHLKNKKLAPIIKNSDEFMSFAEDDGSDMAET